MRLLLTSVSYQDTPGPHQALLEQERYEIHRERGPLSEPRMLELAGEFDAFLCGDDAISAAVIAKALPRLRVISKYGVGLDKIDVTECTRRKLPVLFTPGVNRLAVAEHTFCLLLALMRHLVDSVNVVREGRWERMTGHELYGQSLGIFGLGHIGEEVARRAQAFGMEIHAVKHNWAEAADDIPIHRHQDIKSMMSEIDILTLHASLSDSTRHIIRSETLGPTKSGLIIINTARAELVKTSDLLKALDNGNIAGYATDVLELEPPPPDDPLLSHPRVIVTPHIGSRTQETMPRQAMRATLNLVNYLQGKKDYIQANPF